MKIKRYIVTAVVFDVDGHCDGKARVLATCKSKDEAKNFVIEDMREYVDEHANESMVMDKDSMQVFTNVSMNGCEWNIEDVEIDMVINVGMLRAKDYDYVLNEIREIKEACGEKLLKVIIETCLLTEEEKIKMCEIVTESGADFIKTSTGFSTGGATFDDIALFAKHVGKNVKIKAAGGISSMEDAERFIELGASRLGTSRIVKIVKNS